MPGGNKKVLKAAGLFKYAWPFCYHQALKGWNAILGVSNIKNLRNFTLRDLPFMCCGWNVHRSTVPRNLPCPKRILVKTLCNILKQWSIQFHKDLLFLLIQIWKHKALEQINLFTQNLVTYLRNQSLSSIYWSISPNNKEN